MTKINFIQKKSVKEKAFKTLSVFVGVITILNVSMVGALIPTASAAEIAPVATAEAAAAQVKTITEPVATAIEVAPSAVDATTAQPALCPPGKGELIVIKRVVNSTEPVSSFPLTVGTTSVVSGALNAFNPGTYTVSETNLPGFVASFSGDCDANGQVTLDEGVIKTCYLYNTYTPPKGSITVKKYDDKGALLPGATFRLCPHGSTAGCTTTTDGVSPDATADGVVVFDNLTTSASGVSYDITETAAPAGYIGDASTKTLTLTVANPNQTTSFVNTAAVPVLTLTKTIQNLTHTGAITVANPPHTGDVLQYSLNVQNTGTGDALNYVFTDDVSDIVEYTSNPSAFSHTGGSYDGATRTVSWPATTISKGTIEHRTFEVKVDDSLPSTGDFEMINVFGSTVKVPLCHLVVTKEQKTGTAGYTKDQISLNDGEIVSYKITVKNDGAGNCTGGGVRITDAIDSQLTYVSRTEGSGVNFESMSGGILVWNANIITPGQTKYVEWTATADTDHCGTLSIPNTAKAYADQYHEMTQAQTSNTVYASVSKLCYGTLIVKKEMLDPNGNLITTDTHEFSVLRNGADMKTIAVNRDATYTNQTAGTDLKIVENSDANYDFVKYCVGTSCANDRLAGYTTTVTNGGTTYLTVTNQQKKATITITKDVVDADGNPTTDNTSFGLNWTNGSGTVSESSSFTVSVNPGSAYSFTEVGNAQYTTLKGSCTFDAKDVTSNANLTCEFKNQQRKATLVVKKVLPNNNGGTATADQFSFAVNGGTAIQFEADAQNELTVQAGTYSVVETNPMTGYTTSYSTDCSGTIAYGETKTCTITNDDQPGTLIVKKTLYNYYGGNNVITDFSFTVNGGSSIAFEADGRNDLTVNAGTYTVVENAASGYRTTYEYNTVNDNCNSVVVPNGGSAICYITNVDNAPSITLTKKVLNGTAGVNEFGLTIGSTTVYSGVPQEVRSNEPIAITETGLAGYSFVSITGDAKCPKVLGDTVTLDEGEHMSCTITNERDLGTVIVRKQVDTDGDGIYDVTDDATANTLGFRWSLDNGAADRLMGSSATVTTLDTHTINENSVANYHLVGYVIGEGSCGATETPQLYVGTPTLPLSIAVPKDETMLVTLCNARDTGTLIVKKHVINNDGGQKVASDFSMSISGVNVLGTSTFSGEELGTTRTVATGVYNVTETQLAGYTASYSADCAGTIAYGETKTCTITNDDIVSVIGLVKTATPATVNAGGNITYTLAWSVTGVNPVHDAILTDPLPANTTFVSANCGTTAGTCTIDSSTSTISWSLGTRNAGETGTVTFVVKTASPIVNGTVITNTGTFDTTETPPVTSTVNTPVVSAPILSITKTNDVATFTTPGKVVTYTVVVTNASTATDTAHNVVMTDTLPAGFTFASDGTTTKTFAIGNLTPGQSVTVTYLVNISGTQTAGSYVNTAKAKGDNTTEVTDPSTVEVRVPTVLGSATPELTITKTVSKKTAKPNEILTYTITVKNIGVGDAENVVVTDTLPKDLSFAHATGRTMTWKLGTLEAGHTRVLNVDVRVESDATKGSYTNVAEVTADEIPALQATVTITVPAVLGLATTGTGVLDYMIALLGATLILFGITGLKRRETVA